MARKAAKLGQVQLEVLRYIADHHPVRVSQVAQHFSETSGQARTTILTVMEKLRQKGYLTRKKHRGAFRYSPRISKHHLLTSVVQHFIDDSLGGTVSPFIAYLAETRGLTDSELAGLKKLARKIDRQEGQSQ